MLIILVECLFSQKSYLIVLIAFWLTLLSVINSINLYPFGKYVSVCNHHNN